MTERTERTDAVDRTTEYLVDEETEGFVVVALRGSGDVEVVACEGGDLRPVEVALVAQYVLNRALRSLTDLGGESMSESEVFGAGVAAAGEFGYLGATVDVDGLEEEGP